MNTRKVGRSKLAVMLKALTPDERFFYDNAGYSYDPKTETAEQGRIRCAKSLATAERNGREMELVFLWEDDWSIGDHTKAYDCYDNGGPETCESCVCRDSKGNVLASLHCIDDATNAYRRVIEAELADEAIDRIREEGARVNA